MISKSSSSLDSAVTSPGIRCKEKLVSWKDYFKWPTTHKPVRPEGTRSVRLEGHYLEKLTTLIKKWHLETLALLALGANGLLKIAPPNPVRPEGGLKGIY